MSCNGHNHPKDCKCNFRGGHPNSRPPTWRGWKPRSVRRYINGPNARCPECRAAVFYVPNSRGGGAYYDQFGPPWPKHPCTDKAKNYTPYGRTGKPRLRVKKTQFEQAGWLPFFVRHIERLASGTIVHGVVLDDPTVHHLGSEIDLSINTQLPMYIRRIDGSAQFNFFPNGADEATTIFLFDDCRSDMDLLLKKAV